MYLNTTHADTHIASKVEECGLQVASGRVEAAQIPVQLVVDFLPTFWAVQHRPLRLGQELLCPGYITQTWERKHTQRQVLWILVLR